MAKTQAAATPVSAIKIPDLIASSDLWVKNTSNPRRVLVLAVIDRAGRVTSELIPDTPHPLHLSNMMPKDVLESCKDLYKYVQSGVLVIIDPAAAQKHYKANPMAVEAVQRAYAKVQNRPISREAIASTDLTAKPTEESAAQKAVDSAIGAKTDSRGVDLKVRAILQTVRTGDSAKDADKTLSVDDALLDLANMELTDADVKYIADFGDGRIREFGKAQMEARDL